EAGCSDETAGAACSDDGAGAGCSDEGAGAASWDDGAGTACSCDGWAGADSSDEGAGGSGIGSSVSPNWARPLWESAKPPCWQRASIWPLALSISCWPRLASPAPTSAAPLL